MAVARRRTLMLALGSGALLLLAVLRGFNLYGEQLPWRHTGDAFPTVMSFVNFTKYPPSLDFVLMTLGVGMLALAWLERLDNRFTRICTTFGSVPMFYYLFHLYLLLVLQRLLVMFFGANHGARFGVDDYWLVWLLSFALMLVLYYPCRAFSSYKRRSTQAWVRYF
jgi:uncharacterized membrane protein